MTNLTKLVNRLTPRLKQSLENAVGEALKRRSPTVEIVHWLPHVLLSNDTELNEFLQSADIVFNPEEIIGKCKTYVNAFSKETADDYKKWCDIGFALKNTGVKYLFENKAFEMFRHFSKKSEKYEDDKILLLYKFK